MSLETGDYINDLTITNPAASDSKSQGDDHLRLIKKVLKECLNGFTGGILLTGTDAGAVNALVITPTTALVAYANKQLILVSPAFTNTSTAVTINVSGLGVKSIKNFRGADPALGDLRVGEPMLLQYDGTNFVIVGGFSIVNQFEQLAFGSALPAQSGNAGKFVYTNGSTASWEFAGFTRAADRTSNTIITNADNRKIFNITSGTFTQTLDTLSTFSSDFTFIYKNSGTGKITHTSDGGTWIMYPGECRLFQINGTDTISRVLSGFYYTIESTENFTHPPGYAALDVDAIGGGGGGGGGKGGAAGTSRGGGAGGGGGARVRRIVTGISAFTSTTATIGAGGSPGAGGSSANGSDGTSGGNTSFGTYLIAYGGGLGGGGGPSVFGGGGGGSTGAGGVQTGGTPSMESGFSSGGANGSSGNGGSAEWGGGGGGGTGVGAMLITVGDGGSSIMSAGAGAGGGGLTTGNAEFSGGTGGASGASSSGGGGTAGAVGGGAGGAGAAGANGSCGKGGGGGGSKYSGTGGVGGAGGAPGGGGGAGGAGTLIGGAGGAGGRGECRIMGIV
jgi:hypothetical protein